jgi:phage baseplate assembly protein W
MDVTLPEFDPQAFLGFGWSYPVRFEADGAPALVGHEEDIRQAITIILGTNPGERVMRPDFGAGLDSFVFEPVSPTTMTRVGNRVREALVDWEARIDVLEVAVTTDPDQRSALLIDVSYRVRATNSLHNLVYPFYLDEGSPR